MACCSRCPDCHRPRHWRARYLPISWRSNKRAPRRQSGVPAPETAPPSPDARAQKAQSFAQQHRDRHVGKRRRDAGKENGSASAAWRPASQAADAAQPNAPNPRRSRSTSFRETYRAEALARLQRAIIADCGSRRAAGGVLVNHFCISANKGKLARIWAGSFEREAIRPHVLGTIWRHAQGGRASGDAVFSTTSNRSVRIPAPDRTASGLERKSRPRNHGAYARSGSAAASQDDVTSLARIITGWTFAGRQGQLGGPAASCSTPMRTSRARSGCSARSTEDNGVAQGEAALADIARHPPPRNSSRPDSRATSWPTIRRPRWLARLQDVFRKIRRRPRALTVARFWTPTRPGERR